jgi:hypothetical protein
MDKIKSPVHKTSPGRLLQRINSSELPNASLVSEMKTEETATKPVQKMFPYYRFIFPKISPDASYRKILSSTKKYALRESSQGGFFTVDHPVPSFGRKDGGVDKSTRFGCYRGVWKIFHNPKERPDTSVTLRNLQKNNIEGLFEAMAEILIIPSDFAGTPLDFLISNCLLPSHIEQTVSSAYANVFDIHENEKTLQELDDIEREARESIVCPLTMDEIPKGFLVHLNGRAYHIDELRKCALTTGKDPMTRDPLTVLEVNNLRLSQGVYELLDTISFLRKQLIEK